MPSFWWWSLKSALLVVVSILPFISAMVAVLMWPGLLAFPLIHILVALALIFSPLAIFTVFFQESKKIYLMSIILEVLFQIFAEMYLNGPG